MMHRRFVSGRPVSFFVLPCAVRLAISKYKESILGMVHVSLCLTRIEFGLEPLVGFGHLREFRFEQNVSRNQPPDTSVLPEERSATHGVPRVSLERGSGRGPCLVRGI